MFYFKGSKLHVKHLEENISGRRSKGFKQPFGENKFAVNNGCLRGMLDLLNIPEY